MEILGRTYDPAQIAMFAGDLSAVGGVRQVVLDNGQERGVRVLEFRTGAGLRFEVLVDRGMDIGAAEFQGVGFGWCSVTGVRHPALHENADEDGLNLLRGFTGLVTTGGLDHALAPEEVDAAQYNYSRRSRIRHGLHGRVGNLPARLLGYGENWINGRCLLWAAGEVRQAAVFGEHLRLNRRIEADLESSEFQLTDTVVNAGFDRTPHMYLYHVNLGWPLLEPGAEIGFPEEDRSVESANPISAILPGPQRGVMEELREHRFLTPASGFAAVRLDNTRLGVGFELEFDHRAFPTFVEWRYLREGAYAVGFEPSTNHVDGERAARERGELIWLDPGESRTYRTNFRVQRTNA